MCAESNKSVLLSSQDVTAWCFGVCRDFLLVFVHSIACDVWYVLTILMSFSAIADVSCVAFSGRMAFCIINSLVLNSQWGEKNADTFTFKDKQLPKGT